uniref:Uncharacterized protein n=1 Tax=Megaselia scalaris TaxID=36166 RepID=T1GLU5_MEGSC
MDLIAKQNRLLPTDNWNIFRKNELLEDGTTGLKKGERGFMHYLVINKEALPILKEKEFVIRYGLSKAVIKVYNQLEENDSISEDNPNKLTS